MNEQRPHRLGSYRIVDVLGEGAMGVVYAAVDERLDRPVAVKVMHEAFAGDAVARDRFWREARIAARVNHPSICQLHDVGEDDGQLFLVMERLYGESLAARLQRGAMTVRDAVAIVLDVLSALDVLHRHGIVHRDLKPSNVFLTADGAKLLDFGVAKTSVGATVTTEVLTSVGTMIGTPRYMAPEQVQGDVAGPTADLFAVGAVLYEMLAGRPAFEGDTIPAIVHHIVHDDVDVLAGSPSIAALDRIMHRALEKSPSRRYQNAVAMAEDLRSISTRDQGDAAQYARAITRVTVLPFRLLRADPDIEFLSFSLADAIASALAALDTLVVRSPLAAARAADGSPDLSSAATDARGDAVLTGTVMRSADTVRIAAQLLEAPSGQIVWSHTTRRPVGELFETDDAVVREFVESLALPLAGREQRNVRPDVPSNAKAYEFYLRANALSHDASTWTIARDLYLRSIEADETYAPAWARLGRIYRLLAKFEPRLADPNSKRRRDEKTALAESAFNRALTLNPNLAIADSYYAQLELDLGRGQEAMARLLRRAMIHPTDPHLFSALVSACRYCGLLDASFSAAERARRLDPSVRTSVSHTFFMAGDYLRAAEESERRWQPGNYGGVALLAAGHPDARARMAQEAERYGRDEMMLAYLAGDLPRARAAADRVLEIFPDPEFHFYSALLLAHYGQLDRAVEVLAGAVERGYFPVRTIQHHQWLDAVRDRPEFLEILGRAEARCKAAAAAFAGAGGSQVLGPAP